MVITINKRTIVPTLIIAFAFSRTIKSMTTWVYPFLMMFVFLIGFALYLVKYGIDFSDSRTNNAFEVIKYGFTPYLLIFVYSMIINVVNNNPSANYARTAGSSFSAMIVPWIIAAIIFLYGDDAINLVCNGLLLEYVVEILVGISRVGVSALFEHIKDPLNTYESIFEVHDIGFALFLFLIYYLLHDANSHKCKIIMLVFVEYLIMKRIALVGMVISLFAYGLLCLINKSKERISYRVIFYALFIVACAYLFFIANPDFKNLMMNAGIYNRFLLVDAMSQYYKFSLGFWGQGYGFVSLVIPNASIAGVQGIAALHNDILKDYIELGFIGFFLIYYYLFVHMPMKIFGTIKSKNVKILIALMIYLLVTLFTDNVFEYIAFMGAFMVILASLKIEDEEFPV